jgi:trans-aconitate methyltransferase
LLHHLHKWYPNSKLLGIEPSKNACDAAIKRNQKLEMFNGTIETIELPEKSIDLITIIGVDYLFLDHVAAFKKIASLLKPNGHLYIERNVFLESKAYRNTAINSIHSLFGMNSMMNNWFTESQMGMQLSKFFNVKKSDKYVANIVNGNKNVHVCWLCSYKERTNAVAVSNDYNNNLRYVKRLPQK